MFCSEGHYVTLGEMQSDECLTCSQEASDRMDAQDAAFEREIAYVTNTTASVTLSLVEWEYVCEMLATRRAILTARTQDIGTTEERDFNISVRRKIMQQTDV